MMTDIIIKHPAGCDEGTDHSLKSSFKTCELEEP